MDIDRLYICAEMLELYEEQLALTKDKILSVVKQLNEFGIFPTIDFPVILNISLDWQQNSSEII